MIVFTAADRRHALTHFTRSVYGNKGKKSKKQPKNSEIDNS